MDYIIFKEDSKDWSHIWDSLRTNTINDGLDEPCVADNNGHQWMYMGSFKNGNGIATEFRHLCHPYDNKLHKVPIYHELIDKESIGLSRRVK